MTIGEHPVTPDDRSSELTASFSETAQALFSAGNPADTLRAVVDLAVETIDGCDFASIFVLDANTFTCGPDCSNAFASSASSHFLNVCSARLRCAPGG